MPYEDFDDDSDPIGDVDLTELTTRVAAVETDKLDTVDLPITLAPAPSGGDDTAVLNALLATIGAAGGGVLLLQEGTYSITGLSWTADGVSLRGMGMRASILNSSATTQAVLLDGSDGSIRYARLEDLWIKSNGATGDGLVVHQGVENTVARVTVSGFTGSGKYGVKFAGTASSNYINSFTDCTFSGNDRGALVHGQAEKFDHCRFQGNTGTGVEDFSFAPMFLNCDFEGNGSYGVETSQNNGKVFLGCYWERNVTAQLYSVQTNGLTIIGGRMSAGSTPCDKGIVLGRTSGSIPTGVLVTGLYTENHVTCGVDVVGVQDCQILGNSFTDSTPINIHGSAQLLGRVEIQGLRSQRAATREGFYGATPVVQAANNTDIKNVLVNLGLLVDGGATPLNLDGGTLTALVNVPSGSDLRFNNLRAMELSSTTLGVGEGVENIHVRPSGNITLAGTGTTWGGGVGVVLLKDAGTPPASNPVAGVIMYSEGGAGKGRGTSGTVTTWAAAEPHCPDCGRDFALEWENEETGYLALCMWCVTEGMTKGVIARRPAYP